MHDRISVNALCLNPARLWEVEESWRRLAPKRISFVSSQVFEEGEDLANAIVDRGGYQVETLTHQFHWGALAYDDAIIGPARERLSRAIRFAGRVGARSIYMTTGGRGVLRWEEAAGLFAAAIAPCVEEASRIGVHLLIEPAPFVYAGRHLVHTLRDTITLAELAGIGVCLDIFSMWTEAGLSALIRRAAPMCHLVQISDFVCGDKALPARAVPGDGDIPLRDICRTILDAGYANGFDLELLGPRIEAEGHIAATARAAHHVSDLLDSLGV